MAGNLINIITETGQIVLNVENEVDLDSWTKSFQSVAFKEKTGTLNRTAVIEDNDLYCSSYNEGKFTVTLLPTDTSIKNNLESKIYTLHLTTTEIQLKNYDDSLVCKWPYRFVRKYGYRDGKFTFEAGRKCDTGEGTFHIDHSSPQDIFRCMSAKMKSMKKLINGESINSLDCGENQLNAALSMEAGSRSPLPPLINSPNSPDIDLSITNSHASLRGFLSSTDSINLQFPMKNNSSIIPNKPPRKTLHIVNSSEKIKEANECLGFLDTPPPPPERNKKINERDYECIEGITDAWKTLGIDEVKHTEHVTTPEEELKNFVWQRSKSQRDRERKDLKISIVDINENSTTTSTSSTVTTPVQNPHKFIILDDDDGEIGDESEYDRLEFFASKNKVTSGYKTIVPIIPLSIQPKKKQPCVSDDYELIVPLSTPTTSNPSISNLTLSNNNSSSNNSCNNTSNNIPSTLNYIDTQPSRERLADDRASGYGVLRKTSLPLPSPTSNSTLSFSNLSNNTNSTAIQFLSDDELPNCNLQRLDYAVVSKPKRV